MHLLLFFGTSLFVQAAYWGALHVGFERERRSSRSKDQTSRSKDQTSEAANRTSEDVPPLSVVVAARNERERLPGLLRALARQTHPRFEVVIADDASTDGTPELVRAWSRAHPNVRLSEAAPGERTGKKHALSRSIAAARHEHLALTDADCAPPPGWLSALARRYAAEPDVRALFIGYAPYRKGRGPLNTLARYETFVTGFLTAAATGLGRPYMAVGRNLSYSKTLFRDAGGFERHAYLLSGDDDLLVQDVARRRAGGARALLDPGTFVPSDAPASWRAWLRQKRRHLSDGRVYPPALQFHLALFHATGTLLWLAPALAGWRGAGLLAARLWMQQAALRRAAGVLGEADLLPYQPLLELGYALYNGILAPLSMARELQRW